MQNIGTNNMKKQYLNESKGSRVNMVQGANDQIQPTRKSQSVTKQRPNSGQITQGKQLNQKNYFLNQIDQHYLSKQGEEFN